MTDSVKVSEEARELRMHAYYFSFNPTGVELVDRVLSAVACAGKGYHHTSNWREPFETDEPFKPFRGGSYVEFIQNAATDAAEYIASLEADRRRMDWLDGQREPVFGTSPDSGEQIPVGEVWGVYGVVVSVREAIDAALTTQQEGG